MVKPIFLPLGDEKNNHVVSVVVTMKNQQTTATTTVATQVCCFPIQMENLQLNMSAEVHGLD